MPRRNEVTVLLVEDDDLDAEAVRRSFDKNEVPAKLQRAESGLQALDILRSFNTSDRHDEKACIVFLDLNMPGVNGHEFLAELRSDTRLKKIPVFILTTSDHARDIEKAYAQNVAGYFTKSHLSDLIVVLNQYIDSARLPSLE